MKYLLYLLVPVMLLASCSKDTEEAAQSLQPTSIANVSYGAHSAQVMDVYLPGGRTTDSTKAIVMIHGGGWNTGDKADFNEYITVLKQRLPDYAIFNINYRLASGSDLFPAQENDVKAAVEFIAARAGQYIFNKDKMVLLGASAGAHLALLQAYKYAQPDIAAVVDFFGPTDLVDLYNNPPSVFVPLGLQMVTGTTPSAGPAIYTQSSPINFVTADDPPTILLHGNLDNLVSFSQSSSLKAALVTAGITTELVAYPNEGHGWFGNTLTDSFNRIEAFLDAQVH